jgi:hypothetical protein
MRLINNLQHWISDLVIDTSTYRHLLDTYLFDVRVHLGDLWSIVHSHIKTGLLRVCE